jgi:hypothetical protein
VPGELQEGDLVQRIDTNGIRKLSPDGYHAYIAMPVGKDLFVPVCECLLVSKAGEPAPTPLIPLPEQDESGRSQRKGFATAPADRQAILIRKRYETTRH